MIRLGPSGIGNGFDVLMYLKKIGLNAAEIDFTYQVYLNKENAIKISELAKKLDIKLSVHGQYYVNLASKEKVKVEASKKRILKALEIGHYLNSKYIVFHPGFYQGRDKEKVYELIKKEVIEIQEIIKKNKWNVKLALETTGKKSSFGSLNELLKLRKETNCSICVDFAHLLAREGKRNYEEIFDSLKGIKEIHSHFSGIMYSEKGEKHHAMTKIEEIKELSKEIIKRKLDITIINESPDPVKDSLKMKKEFEDLGYRF